MAVKTTWFELAIFSFLWIQIGSYIQFDEYPRITVCDGNNANLIWKYTGNESIASVQWRKKGPPDVLMADIFLGFSAQGAYANRVTQASTLGNAAITLSSVTSADNGTYKCSVNTVNEESRGYLIVAEAPSGLPYFNKTSNSLTCYPPQNEGTPKVQTVLKEDNGRFLTSLTVQSSGTYHCCILGNAVKCFASTSITSVEICINETFDVETATTVKTPGEGLSKEAVIAMGVLIPVIIFIVVVVVAVVVYIYIYKKKRNKENKKKSSPSSSTTSTSGVVIKEKKKTGSSFTSRKNEPQVGKNDQGNTRLTNTTTTTKPPQKVPPLDITKEKIHTPLETTGEKKLKKDKKKQKPTEDKDLTKYGQKQTSLDNTDAKDRKKKKKKRKYADDKEVISNTENTKRKQDETTGNVNHQHKADDDQEKIRILTHTHNDDTCNTDTTQGKQETISKFNVGNENNQSRIPYENYEKLTAIHIDNETK